MRADALPDKRAAARQWLLPLPDVPTEFRCTGGRMGDNFFSELRMDIGKASHLRILGARGARILQNVRQLPRTQEHGVL